MVKQARRCIFRNSEVLWDIAAHMVANATFVHGNAGAGRAFRLSRQRWLSPLVLVLLWEAGSALGLIPERTLAAPSRVIETFWLLIVNGSLPENSGWFRSRGQRAVC